MSEHETPMTLGVVMIVKNEEKNLGGILSDVRDVMDEICIVDTGSSDGTVALAESFGAKIEHLPWRNDFSAARNHSLACASSDYLLWLDADDRIDKGGVEALLKLKARLRPEKDRAYTLRILGRSKDMPDTLSRQTRIIPNRKGVRFEGRVHEQILPSLQRTGVAIEPVDITIMHTGYHDPDTRAAKARRNLEILTDELREGKDTASQHFFMAMACIGLEDYGQCLEHLYKARQKRTDEDWHHFSYTISTDCLLRLGRAEDACQEIEAGTKLYPDSPLLHYYLGAACMRAGRDAQAAAALKKAASLPLKVDSYPSPPDLDAAILLQYGKALEKTGQTDEAIKAYARALKSGARRKDLHQALGMAYLQSGRITEALSHLETARELSASVDPVTWLSLARLCYLRKDPGQAQRLYLEILREIPEHLQALVGILDTSIDLDDTESFFNALEQILIVLDVPIPEASIDSLAQCAELCMRAADRIKAAEPDMARRLAQTALRLDASNAGAHLLLADLFARQGDLRQMLASLESALQHGADHEEVRRRIDSAPVT